MAVVRTKRRYLSADDLGLPLPEGSSSDTESADTDEQALILPDSDPIVERLNRLRDFGFLSFLFVGPPGCGKTWYARQIALKLTNGDAARIRFIQFHPSYQYEDFVEGYVPSNGGFVLAAKHLVEMCWLAEEADPDLVIIVLDEFSRCDPSRVFGEALTYIETTRRGEEFALASGSALRIPENLIFIGTANPDDRSVDELDLALERRFAKIEFRPDVESLGGFLQMNGVAEDLSERILEFFRSVQKVGGGAAPLGHGYFINVRNTEDLELLWHSQLRYYFERIFRMDPESLESVQRLWSNLTRDDDSQSIKPT